MSAFTSRELRREALQRAIYSRLNNHPDTTQKFLYTDAWLIARHAVEAVFEAEARREAKAEDPWAASPDDPDAVKDH
jgi:hypothetical protein